MSFLVDTNVLLRSVQPAHPMHAVAIGSLKALMEEEVPLSIAFQNLAEFWNTATRPVVYNGLGLTIEETREEVTRLEDFFQVLTENSTSYGIWKALVLTSRVVGVQVHDARLAAMMKTYDIPNVLTFNVADFSRFPGIAAIHPSDVFKTIR